MFSFLNQINKRINNLLREQKYKDNCINQICLINKSILSIIKINLM